MEKVKKSTSNNKVKNKNIIIQYLKFYNKELKKVHIISFFLMLIVFAYSIGVVIDTDEVSFIEETIEVSRLEQVGEKIMIMFLIILSGITPYVFIPVIGLVGMPLILAGNMVDYSIAQTVLTSITSVIQLLFISLCVSTGIYYCRCATKKFRYSQKASFGIDDVIQQLYEIKKDEKKLQAFKDKRLAKAEKKEKLNVKIKYKMMLISFLVSVIPIIILTAISGV